MTARPTIMVVVRWTQDSVHHEQAYGPWTAREDGSHLGEISAFRQRWNASHPDAKFTSASMYLVSPPGEGDTGAEEVNHDGGRS